MSETEDDDGILGSIGFMFDAQHKRQSKIVNIEGITIKLRLIGEDPGHVQSGQYLWPAATYLAHYLVDNWPTLKASRVIELGSGVGLAGLLASKLSGAENVVLTDYDHGALELLRENAAANKSDRDHQAEVTVEFLQWGKVLPPVFQRPRSSSSNNESSRADINDINNTKLAGEEEQIQAPVSEESTAAEQLVIGSDLLYSADIVRPLLVTVKELLITAAAVGGAAAVSSGGGGGGGSGEGGVGGSWRKEKFVLVSSFDPGEAVEKELQLCISDLKLSRVEIRPLNIAEGGCRVEEYYLLYQ